MDRNVSSDSLICLGFLFEFCYLTPLRLEIKKNNSINVTLIKAGNIHFELENILATLNGYKEMLK